MDEEDTEFYVCPFCGHEAHSDQFGKHCPNCGGDLDEYENDSD